MHRQFRKVNLSPKYNSGLIAGGHNFKACFKVGNREHKHEGHLTVKETKSVLEEVISRPGQSHWQRGFQGTPFISSRQPRVVHEGRALSHRVSSAG